MNTTLKGLKLFTETLEAVRKITPLILIEPSIDNAFLMRESSNLLAELVKSLDKLRAKMEEQLDAGEGEFCKAIEYRKIWYKLPCARKSNEFYFDTSMEIIGVPRHVYENELVRFHGPGVVDYCAKLIAEGKNPPFQEVSAVSKALKYVRKRSYPEVD